MDYRGPCRVDYDNVRALNEALLAYLASVPDDPALAGLPTATAGRLATLTATERRRLAAAPFMLMSFRERDPGSWDGVLDAQGEPDLFAGSGDRLGLIAAGLGFVWQLARQNPYAARLICGASLHWCEALAEQTLCAVLAAAAVRDELLVLRAADRVRLWDLLLDAGVSRRGEIRRAAHISALHAILSGAPVERQWQAAACPMHRPSLSVTANREA